MKQNKKLIDIEREVILRIDKRLDYIYLDFFTKEGLKTIKIQKLFYEDFLKQLKGGKK